MEIGLESLKQILKDNWEVVAAFSLAKKYAKKTSGFVDFSPIAKKYGFTLYKIKDINEQKYINMIKKIAPDLIIICGWQKLVCKEILDIPRNGAIGFHSSLLPKYRGRAPVNWAIIKGERKTGITMFYCSPEADTGDIIAQKSFSITLADTCKTVYDKSAKAARQLLHIYLPQIEAGRVKKKKNESAKFHFWPKRRPEDGLINWEQNSLNIHNWIRALTYPYPGAFSYYNGKKYFIWESKLAHGKMKILRYSPGEIIKISKNGKKIKLLVATKDKPLWVSSIRTAKNKSGYNFVKGEKFT